MFCRDTVGNTPLHYAMELKDWDSQQSIIQLLKSKGAKADAINMNGERPEFFILDDLPSEGVIERCEDHRNFDGQTMCHIIASEEYEEIGSISPQWLAVRDYSGQTPYHLLACNKDYGGGFSTTTTADQLQDNQARTPLLLGACTYDSVGTHVAAMINQQPVSGEGETALHLLAKSDHLNVLVFKQLVHAGAKYAFPQWLMCIVVSVLQHFACRQASAITGCSVPSVCCKAICLQVTCFLGMQCECKGQIQQHALEPDSGERWSGACSLFVGSGKPCQRN